MLFDSGQSVFQITDISPGQLRDITPYIVAIDGLPGPRELAEATTLVDGGRMFYPTLENVVVTLELLWSDDAESGSDTVLGPLRTHSAAVAFDYGPEGKAQGDIKYHGNAWVRNYQILSRVGQMVSARCELQVNGTVGRTTYA
ncbi:hypothetical protein ES703_63731 [subsurface metagenome]